MLHDITFTARPGQTTAFIGATGLGQDPRSSTSFPRFYDVTGGLILVDGIDVREVTQHDLRDKIGYVPQKSMLFSGHHRKQSALRRRKRHRRDPSRNAADDRPGQRVHPGQSGRHGDRHRPGRGTNVSGGQKQRLSIARALVKKPPIYIFDDSFSALDFKTDAALRRALKRKDGHEHRADRDPAHLHHHERRPDHRPGRRHASPARERTAS